jgi:hypothetical protein
MTNSNFSSMKINFQPIVKKALAVLDRVLVIFYVEYK